MPHVNNHKSTATVRGFPSQAQYRGDNTYRPLSIAPLTPNPHFGMHGPLGLLYGGNGKPGLDYRCWNLKISRIGPVFGDQRDAIEFLLQIVPVWLQDIEVQIGRDSDWLTEEAANAAKWLGNHKRIPALDSPGGLVADSYGNDLHAGPRGEIDDAWLDLPSRTTRSVRRDGQVPVS